MQQRGKIFLIVFIVILMLIVLFFNYCVAIVGSRSSIDSIAIVNTTYGTFNETNSTNNHYFINVTKTSGGWPYLKNDVYNTLGVMVRGCSWTGGEWDVNCEAVDLSSSRDNDSSANSNAIRSQTLILSESSTDTRWSIWQSWGGGGITIGSWPHGYIKNYTSGRNATDLNGQMTQVTVSAASNGIPYPLSASDLKNNLTGGADSRDQVSMDIWERQKMGEKIVGWDWNYADGPWDYKSDSAAVAVWNCRIPYGGTLEYDVIDYTYWGLFDSSRSTVHVKITVPPDPIHMNRSEMKANGITAWVLNDTFISSATGNQMNITYLPSEPQIVGYSVDNVSVEMY